MSRYIIECRERMFQPWFIVGSEKLKSSAQGHAERYQEMHPTSVFRVTDIKTGERFDETSYEPSSELSGDPA